MADVREPSERYAAIAKELLEEEGALAHIAASKAKVAYLSSSCEKKRKGHLVFGQCEKVPGKYRWCVPWDFTITVFEPNVRDFDDDQIRILIFHELLHVGVGETSDGEEKLSLVPHDVEEFREIAERFGLDWAAAR